MCLAQMQFIQWHFHTKEVGFSILATRLLIFKVDNASLSVCQGVLNYQIDLMGEEIELNLRYISVFLSAGDHSGVNFRGRGGH